MTDAGQQIDAGVVESILAGTPTGMLIDGRWVDGCGARFDVVDPASGAVIASVPSASVPDGLAAVAAAQEALPGWAARAPRERSEILRRAFELMTARAEHLAALIVVENGKTLADARGEVAYAAEFFRWYAEEAVRVPVRCRPRHRGRIGF
jgi:succinate-semialdehyde dehydrogenase / glutarate-semialdehyde dehydrogenase